MATLTPTVTPSPVRRAVGSRWFRLTTRLVVGAGVLIAVVVHVGTGPFLRGLLSVDGWTIAAALLLVGIATAAAAWRWRLIASRLGVSLPWSIALGMYYRSQFLNSVLPGGVVGDIHRAIAHGQRAENIAQAARAVAIERTAGQVVQLTVTVPLILCFGGRFSGYLLAALAVGIAIIGLVSVIATKGGPRMRRAAFRELRELRTGLGSTRVSLQVVAASLVVVACHLATFGIAVAAVGAELPPLQLLVVALVILFGAAIPLNVGGWGPREGVAGWAFALAGLGASAGVAASTLYGILAMIAVAPGAIVILVFAARARKTKVLTASSLETTS
ncbi:MAG: YbhN family protein [Actinomycetales bacterium]